MAADEGRRGRVVELELMISNIISKLLDDMTRHDDMSEVLVKYIR